MFFSSHRKKHTNYQCFRNLLTQNTTTYIVFNNAGVPQKTFYAHARYLVMVSRPLYNKTIVSSSCCPGLLPFSLGLALSSRHTHPELFALSDERIFLPVNNAKICATCESLAHVIEPAPFEPWNSIKEDSRRNVSSVVRNSPNN